jgi:2-polyprenyl-6-methoxyphenol hydroxylase-like FAD-dependent oxidoreductase
MTADRLAGPETGGTPGEPMRCVVVGGSLVGLSAAIALSRLGFAVAERSPARAVDGGGGLGVDVALLREVTGIETAASRKPAAYLAHATRRTVR